MTALILMGIAGEMARAGLTDTFIEDAVRLATAREDAHRLMCDWRDARYPRHRTTAVVELERLIAEQGRAKR